MAWKHVQLQRQTSRHTNLSMNFRAKQGAQCIAKAAQYILARRNSTSHMLQRVQQAITLSLNILVPSNMLVMQTFWKC